MKNLMNTKQATAATAISNAHSPTTSNLEALELIHPAYLLHRREDAEDGEWEESDGDSYVSSLTPIVGLLSLDRWNDRNDANPNGLFRRRSHYPIDAIRQLIVGRVYPLPFPELGDDDIFPFPVMSIEETLQSVGVAEPSVRQIEAARRTLIEHLGQPRVVFERERWLVIMREDDKLLDPDLAEAFPIDHTMVFPVRKYLEKRQEL